ncbi:uncharacterized protein PGTG_19219 [Puccinia graminis f. sp. tritici CRL 75-36-700-3]|uniref:Uncharacterized protein n=1 Tax=Puccinia graminis f. sp. tritici (strain CRL 75-36-700-3 / race SCCL) TaxID=418459 RepID=E3L989_PUCGT|nr:uncharacterized protein PGTG_19219 [Puccinia graminis f. sp. tritici CRL 75-36-700-3]EFP93114.1 hypothetical protein PGTG_19219 [Puccinia graminis f. sp. tritici CRL 75-36-700-3]
MSSRRQKRRGKRFPGFNRSEHDEASKSRRRRSTHVGNAKKFHIWNKCLKNDDTFDMRLRFGIKNPDVHKYEKDSRMQFSDPNSYSSTKPLHPAAYFIVRGTEIN